MAKTRKVQRGAGGFCSKCLGRKSAAASAAPPKTARQLQREAEREATKAAREAARESRKAARAGKSVEELLAEPLNGGEAQRAAEAEYAKLIAKIEGGKAERRSTRKIRGGGVKEFCDALGRCFGRKPARTNRNASTPAEIKGLTANNKARIAMEKSQAHLESLRTQIASSEAKIAEINGQLEPLMRQIQGIPDGPEKARLRETALNLLKRRKVQESLLNTAKSYSSLTFQTAQALRQRMAKGRSGSAAKGASAGGSTRKRK